MLNNNNASSTSSNLPLTTVLVIDEVKRAAARSRKKTQANLLGASARNVKRLGLALAPVGAGNSKTRTVGTYRNIDESCPSCPLKGKGCYAQQNYVGISQRRARDKDIKTHLNTVTLALSVAAACKGRARLHVSGDFGSNGALDVAYLEGVEAVAKEVQTSFGVKQGQYIAWTYTHFPEEVFSEWEERLRAVGIGVRYSDKQGTNGAIVAKFDNLPATLNGQRVIKCPAQTQDNFTCDQCRLCVSGKHVVAFDPHGANAAKLGVL